MLPNHISNTSKFPFSKFLLWKARDISVASISIIMGFLTIFYTDYLHMPATMVGFILFTSKIVDGITDLFAAYLIDNTNIRRFGKGRPYEIFVPFAWFTAVLLFFCPEEWNIRAKSAWLFINYSLTFSVFTTLFGTASTPYMIRAFKTREIITKVVSYGSIVTTFGVAAINFSFLSLIDKFANSVKGWHSLLLFYSIPLTLLGILRGSFVKEDLSISLNIKNDKIKMSDILIMLKTNKYIWYYSGIIAVFSFIMGFNVHIYYFKYIVKNIPLLSFLSIVPLILTPLMYISPRLIKTYSVSNIITFGAGVSLIGYLINFFAGSNIVLLVLGAVLNAFGILPITYLGTIITINLTTYNQYKGLPPLEASTGMISGLITKLFGGLGMAAFGYLLGFTGYISNDVNIQSSSTILMIKVMYSIIPLVGMAIIMFFSQKLLELDKQLPEIEKELINIKSLL